MLYELRIRVPIDRITSVIQAATEVISITPIGRKIITKRFNGGEETGMELAKSFIAKHKDFTYDALTKLFVAKGRNVKSVSPLLTQLRANGDIKRLHNGEYRRTK